MIIGYISVLFSKAQTILAQSSELFTIYFPPQSRSTISADSPTTCNRASRRFHTSPWLILTHKLRDDIYISFSYLTVVPNQYSFEHVHNHFKYIGTTTNRVYEDDVY
jgi:hypothetical protein